MLPGIGIIANVAAIALGGVLGLGGTLRTMLSANADG